MLSLFLRTITAMIMIVGVALPATAADAHKAADSKKPAPQKLPQLNGTPLTTETLRQLRALEAPTTETLEAKRARMEKMLPKIPSPEEAEKLTTDSLAALFETGRPALGVGTFQSYDSATSTVVIRMDPKLTAFPHTMDVKARRWHISADRVYERERNGDRKFKINARTYIVDDSSPLDRKPGQIERPTPRLPISSFKVGDKISVSYRIEASSSAIPNALNISKVDPSRTFYTPDFDPVRGRLAVRHAGPTSGTRAATTMTSATLRHHPMRRQLNQN